MTLRAGVGTAIVCVAALTLFACAHGVTPAQGTEPAGAAAGDGPGLGGTEAAETPPIATRSSDSLPCHEVLELSIRLPGASRRETAFSALVGAPGAEPHWVQGFHWGGEIWKLRVRPDRPGRWTYGYRVESARSLRAEGSGEFDCTPSGSDGPVVRDPANPFQWRFASGKPYFPLGLQDCIARHSVLTSPISMYIDGERRGDGRARRLSPSDYFATYGQAGFNLLRFSQRNCSYTLMGPTESDRELAGAVTDDLLALARRHGLRVMFGIFGIHTPKEPSSAPDGTPVLDPEERRFVDYVVARWGVYVDFWELLNEGRPSDAWTTAMARHVRAIDPDRKPVTTSWERPDLAEIDVNAPHWYESENELQSDLRVQWHAAHWKGARKPVIVGEQGNRGMNWDPRSAVRMRIRTWTALFEEIALVFWNTSWAKDGMHGGETKPGKGANIYLGPEERGYVRVFRRFADRFEAGVRPAPVELTSPPERARAYALRSKRVVALYVHHAASHDAAMTGLKVRLELPGEPGSELTGEWSDPATGELLARTTFRPGLQLLEVPSFTVDVAFLATLSQEE